MNDSFLTNDLVEIYVPGINADEIMTHIGQNICRRQVEAKAKGIDLNRLAGGYDKRPWDNHIDEEMYSALRQVNLLYDRILVRPSITAHSTPILNSILTQLRRTFHNLVIYYVNMLGKRQIVINQTIADVLNEVVNRLNTSEQDEHRDLRREVENLRQRVAELEAKMVSKN